MGTRNLTAVYYKGEYKIAQYGQWDGYPDGQGVVALSFLRERMDLEKFKKALDNTRQITEEEFQAAWEAAGADGSGWVTFEVSKQLREMRPELSRDTGAEILDIVQAHPDGIALNGAIEFAADGLSCEWAWVIDLDAGTFECYQGRYDKGRELTPDDRFYFLREHEEDGIHGITMVAQWRLDDLPDEEEFLAYFKDPDEDEEDEEDA